MTTTLKDVDCIILGTSINYINEDSLEKLLDTNK